ncbi:zinc finger protein Elbow-like [Neocloeon triangulifer]|uniref:zinc finger protein Elbow-like n=1 Tax=Neocloeon triangulifer TaxID=2078957 RepID=UPI00286F0868|nr:zinc finger protein Elbow-like [Neocloeon triangulifer]
MLTSSNNASNQYLRPEYLTPLPTTLDAKKSPLALLAQTCSQIGADCPNSKPLLPPLDKSHKKSESSRDKVSPATNDSSSNSTPSVTKSVASFKPYETTKDIDVSGRSSSGRSKTPQSSKSVTPNNNNNTIVASANGPTTTRSPTTSPHSRKTPSEGKERERHSPVSSKAAAFSSLITGESKDSTPSSFKPSPSSSSAAALAAAAAAASLPPGFLGYPHLPDLALSSLMFGKTHPGLNPYLSYSRMKTPGGAESLVPVCRDPYCTGCTLSSHLLKGGATPSSAQTATTPTSTASTAGSCPSGCVTCDHQKGASSPSALGAAAALALPHLIPGLGSPYASPLTAHMPYVCNWIAGDNYCGKRFTSSDELLQHLRSHTNLTDSLGASMPTHPLLASHAAAMAALHRTYPTPPLSPLAAARYHPYSKPPLPHSLSAAAFQLHPHPGMPPYFSPYSLYGRAASGMHP